MTAARTSQGDRTEESADAEETELTTEEEIQRLEVRIERLEDELAEQRAPKIEKGVPRHRAVKNGWIE